MKISKHCWKEEWTASVKTGKKEFDEALVPPTLLHFEIVLEAYMGYRIGATDSKASLFNSPDSALPRAAVMGGSIVAALTSFQDYEIIVQAFTSSGMFTNQGAGLLQGSEYFKAKEALTKTLHTHFLTKSSPFRKRRWDRAPPPNDESQRSVFAKGNVDIFLQPSPLTQALVSTLEQCGGITDCLLDLIGSYNGTSGRNSFAAGDFERMLSYDLKGFHLTISYLLSLVSSLCDLCIIN
jgi:hypothetical protein